MRSTLKQTVIAMASAAIGCGGATATHATDRGEYSYDYDGARSEAVCGGADSYDQIAIDLGEIAIAEERASQDVLVTCEEAEETRDAICGLSEQICQSAAERREPTDEERCEEGKAHCVQAQANVEAC